MSGHSPLGASGAERWMNCPGSNILIRELQPEDNSDPVYRQQGTAIHEAAERCLKSGCDPWELVGQEFGKPEDGPLVKFDTELSNHVQSYLDVVRPDMDRAAMCYVELPISSDVHPSFYGTLDFAAIIGKPATQAQADEWGWKACFIVPELVIVTDLKGGEGIIVEPDDNPQLKYYAFGLIDQNKHWEDETPVLIRIVQPRAFHVDGPVREWTTTVGEIREWVHDTLVPAMFRAEMDNELDAGPWCRFCPAKLVCPLLTSLFRAAATANPQEIPNYNDESIARSYRYTAAVRHYLKALEDDVYRRLNAGIKMEGSAKLVNKKSNRVYNSGAGDEAKKKFGTDAMKPPEMKSPAELEKLGPAAAEWVREHCHQPATGLTVAMWDDPRIAVKVQTPQEAFGAAVAALDKAGETS